MAAFITKACPVCKDPSVLQLELGQVMDLRLGVPAERALPLASPELVELVDSGTHADCYVLKYGEEDCG